MFTSFPSKPEELPAHLPDDLVSDVLKDVNPRARDRHVYFWRGQQVARVVTQLIHQFTAVH